MFNNDLKTSPSFPSLGYVIESGVKRAILEGQRLGEHPIILEGGMNNPFVNNSNRYVQRMWAYSAVPVKESVLDTSGINYAFKNLTIADNIYYSDLEPVKWLLHFKTNKTSPYSNIVLEGKKTNKNKVRFIVNKIGNFVEWSLIDGSVEYNWEIPSEISDIQLTYFYHPQSKIELNTDYYSPIYQMSGSMTHTLFIRATSNITLLTLAAFQSTYWNNPFDQNSFNRVVSFNNMTLDHVGDYYEKIIPINLHALTYVYWHIKPSTKNVDLQIIWHAEHMYI